MARRTTHTSSHFQDHGKGVFALAKMEGVIGMAFAWLKSL
jgi:hypothetical protein